MKRNSRNPNAAGFTIVEMCIAVSIFIAVGALAYTMLVSSMTLLAKNLSLNASNTTVRATLDRLATEINQANGVKPSDPDSPKNPGLLVDADGTPTSSTNGPSAGVVIDRYVGGPYIVGNPSAGLAANATSFKLYYSTDSLANPPSPVKNDVVIMDGVTRALVASSTTSTGSFSAPTPSPIPNPGACATVTLQSSLGNYTNPKITSGTAISWLPSTQQTAYVLHRKAFVVVPVNGVNGPPAELRMYPDAENLSDIINDSSKYVILSREIGTMTYNGIAEHTPFSIVQRNGVDFLNVSLRVEDRQFNQRLAGDFNSFFRVDSLLCPRNNP